MKRKIKTFVFFLILVVVANGFSYAKTIDIDKLVDDFYGSTDLQRNQMLKDNLGRAISTNGIVTNVGEYDFFDVTNDIKGTYYQITTEQRRTKNHIPYQVIFLFKDRDKVQDINKGENVQKDGRIIKIEDERLQIAVWLFCGDLTEKDKALFKQD